MCNFQPPHLCNFQPPLTPSEESQALAESVSIQAQQRVLERDEKLTEIFDRQEKVALDNARKGQFLLPQAEDSPPVEPVKPLTGSDLVACDYCDAKVRGDEYREHMKSKHAGEAPR